MRTQNVLPTMSEDLHGMAYRLQDKFSRLDHYELKSVRKRSRWVRLKPLPVFAWFRHTSDDSSFTPIDDTVKTFSVPHPLQSDDSIGVVDINDNLPKILKDNELRQQSLEKREKVEYVRTVEEYRWRMIRDEHDMPTETCKLETISTPIVSLSRGVEFVKTLGSNPTREAKSLAYYGENWVKPKLSRKDGMPLPLGTMITTDDGRLVPFIDLEILGKIGNMVGCGCSLRKEGEIWEIAKNTSGLSYVLSAINSGLHSICLKPGIRFAQFNREFFQDAIQAICLIQLETLRGISAFFSIVSGLSGVVTYYEGLYGIPNQRGETARKKTTLLVDADVTKKAIEQSGINLDDVRAMNHKQRMILSEIAKGHVTTREIALGIGMSTALVARELSLMIEANS